MGDRVSERDRVPIRGQGPGVGLGRNLDVIAYEATARMDANVTLGGITVLFDRAGRIVGWRTEARKRGEWFVVFADWQGFGAYALPTVDADMRTATDTWGERWGALGAASYQRWIVREDWALAAWGVWSGND